MKKIAIINPKGGVGKTTFTDQLAFNFHDGGLAVQVADLDSQQGTFFHARIEQPKEPDIILIDTKGALEMGKDLPVTIRQVIEDADLVLLPTPLQRDSIEVLPKVTSICDNLERRYIIVPNMVKMSRSVDQAKYAQLCRDYPGRISTVMVRECTEVNKARDVLVSINDMAPKSNASQDFQALSDEIAKELY